VSTSFEEVLRELRERDVRDRGRALAPLKRADDAVLIDTTNLDADQVMNAMKSRIIAGGSARKGLKRN
jgi:cytidylate kinase